MFTTTRLTTKTTSVTTGLVDYTNHTGLALCGHIILPEFECTLVGPGQYHLGGNNYSFDALQAYCFGINIKL